jgi:hypothetical protein
MIKFLFIAAPKIDLKLEPKVTFNVTTSSRILYFLFKIYTRPGLSKEEKIWSGTLFTLFTSQIFEIGGQQVPLVERHFFSSIPQFLKGALDRGNGLF